MYMYVCSVCVSGRVLWNFELNEGPCAGTGHSHHPLPPPRKVELKQT